jgi:hypothetical protein
MPSQRRCRLHSCLGKKGRLKIGGSNNGVVQSAFGFAIGGALPAHCVIALMEPVRRGGCSFLEGVDYSFEDRPVGRGAHGAEDEGVRLDEAGTGGAG